MAINPQNPNNAYVPPAAQSPLSIQGHSLSQGVLTCNEGQWSNISEVLRTQFQAKTLNNFQMLTRGIWSSPTGIGWTKQRSAAFNSGASFKDFGIYEDFLGNQTMLFQVGNKVYSYNLGTSTETAYNAPLNNVSTSLAHLPCMRPFVDNTGTAAPITVYCNGDIQPEAITGITASSLRALNFIATGSPTTTNPNGGAFDTNYPIATFSPGTIIANYAITATGTPQNCCLGPDGNVWYTDYNNSKIGKITPLGVVTEYATTTGAAGPLGICAGPDGNLWFTENLAGNIAKITTAGVVTEYGAKYTHPTGICLGPGGYLFTCYSNGVNWEGYDTTGTSRFDSETGAGFQNWQAICTGPDGNVWGIGTTFSGSVTLGKMTLSGTFTSYAANANPGTQGYGICAGPDNRVWFADNGTNQIGAITTAGVISYYKTPTTTSAPYGICLGSDNNLWFTENGANKLGRVTPAGIVTEFVGLPASAGLQGICTGQDGNVWFCEEANVAIGTALVSNANPKGICVGPDNRLWFCEYSTNKIGAITTTGTLTEYILPNTLSGPLDICSDGTNLWFTEFQGNRIGKITTAGVITEYSLSTPNSQPVGIVLGPDGNLWFTESNNAKVAKITTGGSITEYSITGGTPTPWGICTDGTSLYFCDSTSNQIGKSTTGGSITKFTVPTTSSVPLWIAFGSDGRLWFTENNGNKIGAMTTGGSFTEYVIPTASSLPQQITSASDNNLYFVENGANNIGRVNPTTGAITEFPITVNNSQPYGIVDGPDESLWFTMNGASEIGNFLYGGSGTWPGTFQLTKKTYSKPRFCVYFNNRMAYFGFDPSTNAALDVLISNQGSAEKFITSAPIQATDAVSFTIPGLGLPTGLAAFRLTNTNNQEVLILGFQRGIAVVMGNGVSSDATTYAADILTYEYGLMSNRTFAQIQNDMYFLSTNGVRNFSNLTINANLLNSALTYQMQDVISSITTTPIAGTNVLYNAQSFAVHHRDTLEMQFWFPETTDGSGGANFINQHAIIMNYNTNNPVPQQLTPIFSTKSGTSVACGIEFQGVMYGGGYDGHLQQHYSGNTYNGVPIPGTINLALINSGNIQSNLELRRGTVVTEGGDQNFQILTYFYTKQQDGTLARAPSPEELQTLSASVQGITTLGSVQFVDWTLGYSSFPANHIKHLEFEATGQGPYAEFALFTNGINQSLDFAALAYTITQGGLRP